ncbi:uncharacterized protein LOC114774199 isoform X2 [Denticeps clupeoides]|uniref:uncharacterized protein LOC114774199 isoform X2 n=1 Tax=Denticeps clupeoides TaxID=299321 RepID=UPI0010A49C0B|nr:uncharacterized protein LOC114774199 isoform X2 [Denticeps clupeoides]
MKILAALILLLVDSASGVIHSWTGLYTAATGIKDLPEFVGVNLFDDEVTGNFDSENNQFEIRQDWVKELGEKYVEDQTKSLRNLTWKFKENLTIIMTEFNQTGDQGAVVALPGIIAVLVVAALSLIAVVVGVVMVVKRRSELSRCTNHSPLSTLEVTPTDPNADEKAAPATNETLLPHPEPPDKAHLEHSSPVSLSILLMLVF